MKKSSNKNDSVGEVYLPPGYGADKLAILLIKVLEEKVKVSDSHSERELFRRTIHVLQCRGCKDREKHNKVRCRRCEDRDKKKNEVRKEKDKTQNVGDRSEKKISNEHDESEDCKKIGVTENEQKVEERSNRSEVVDKNVVILGRPDEDSSNNEN